jgi:TIR domain
MSYVFVSHASEDKIGRVRPLVEALLQLGVRLWIDRPGYGKNNFNFSQDYIERFGILSLRAGRSWDEQIREAVRDCGAVLICLSKGFSVERQVLTQEMLLGLHHDKLVACIVDDTPFERMPSDLGLAAGSRIQAERIDPERLAEAVARMEAAGATDEALPAELRTQWETVRKLVADINRILDRSGPRLPTPSELMSARAELLRYPIGPMVTARDIPLELIRVFAECFDEPNAARNFFERAMQLRADCNPEKFDDRQIVLGRGEVLSPSNVSAEEFWSDVLTGAGHKSRRTLAAFLVAPGAPRQDEARTGQGGVLEGFKRWLQGNDASN